MSPFLPRRKRTVIPQGRSYTRLREHPVWKRGYKSGWLEAALWIVGFVAIGLGFRWVLA